MMPEDQATLQLIVCCDPTFLIEHIKENTHFDSNLLIRIFSLAKERANELLLDEKGDGWQRVPKEMNDAMQLAGAEAVRVDTTAINKLFIATRVYRAALAAAPVPPEPRK